MACMILPHCANAKNNLSEKKVRGSQAGGGHVGGVTDGERAVSRLAVLVTGWCWRG